MKNSQAFITSLQNEALGFGLVITAWAIVSILYPGYIIPSPALVLSSIQSYLPNDFFAQAGITLIRVAIGFSLSLLLGSASGIAAYALGYQATVSSVMLSLQVIPGTVLGIIFLLMFGIGNAAPIMLITVLVMPTIAINTINGLTKKNQNLEQYLTSIGSNRKVIFQYIYLPTLIPTLQSNLSLGIGLATKIVVLGEFIGAQNGLGYLLNRAQITFNMKEVFFYLMVLLGFTLVFQAALSVIFAIFFKKYFFTE